MAGRGPNAKAGRRRANEPARGDYHAANGVGWQYGEIPRPPDGLKEASVIAWNTWFRAWYAAHWTPDDLPQIHVLALLFDQIEREEFQRASEFRLLADTLGVTPKGQQDRRWVRPLGVGPAAADDAAPKPASPYARLRAVK